MHDEEYDLMGKNRVYVNNMNTTQPTFTLPENLSQRSKIQRERFEWEDRALTQNRQVNDCNAFRYSTLQRDNPRTMNAAIRTSQAGNATSMRAKNVATVAEEAAAADSALSLPRNPHLEELFQRLTRRLQREINYNEAARAPLATQYGVSMNVEHYTQEYLEQWKRRQEQQEEEEEEEEREEETELQEHQQNLPIHSNNTTFPFPVNEENVLLPTTLSSPVPTENEKELAVNTIASVKSERSINSSKRPSGAELERLSQHTTPQPSLLVQYRPAVLPSRMTNVINLTDNDGDVEERALMEQPCPGPLRLVIEHVQETLLNKLGLAERGSMCDAVRFIFESRALLDRLLKEMPHYVQFHESMLYKMPELTTRANNNNNNSNNAGISHVEWQQEEEEESESPSQEVQLDLEQHKKRCGSTLPRSQSAIRSVASSFSYSPSTGNGPRHGTAHPHSSNITAQLHQLYQEFRKQPVLIPRGVYVEDTATGSVTAALDTTTERTLASMTRHNTTSTVGGVGGAGMIKISSNNSSSRSVSNSSVMLPPINSLSLSSRLLLRQSESTHNDTLQDITHSSSSNNHINISYGDGEEVQLPAHYGRSRRLLERLRKNSISSESHLWSRGSIHPRSNSRSRVDSNTNVQCASRNKKGKQHKHSSARRKHQPQPEHECVSGELNKYAHQYNDDDNDHDDDDDEEEEEEDNVNEYNRDEAESNSEEMFSSSDTDIYEEVNEENTEQRRSNGRLELSESVKDVKPTMANYTHYCTSSRATCKSKPNNKHNNKQQQRRHRLLALRRYSSVARRRATQHLHASTLTDENNGNMVTKEEYERVVRQAQELEIHLHEANHAQTCLIEELQMEGSYAEQHARVLQYLRSTLIKECNMLRSQLSYLAQRQEGQSFLPIQQQQQQQQISSSSYVYSRMQSMRESALPAGNATSDTYASSQTYTNDRTPVAHHIGHRSNSMSQNNLPQSQRLNNNNINYNNNNNNNNTFNGTNTMSSTNGLNINNNTVNSSSSNENSMSLLNESQRINPVRLSMTGPATSRLTTKSEDRKWNTLLHTTQSAGVSNSFTANDLTSIQSLLDLVLLAVEKEQTLTCSADVLQRYISRTTPNNDLLEDNARIRASAIKAEFESKQQLLKNSVMAMRVKDTFTIASKDKEIARLQSLTDMKHVERIVRSYVQELRREFVKMRHGIEEQLHSVQVNISNTITSILNRTRVMDSTLDDNVNLRTAQEALRMLIDGAHALMVPMLTNEYAHGYHPWPAKSRNSIDPLAHVVQSRFGVQEVLHLREPLNELSELYVAIHRVMSHVLIVPDINRPMVGRTLETLCAKLLLNPLCPSDLLFAVRQHYATECHVRRQIAVCNMKILWNAYMQSVLTSRAVTALIEGGMNPNTTTLPVANKINALARERGILARERLLLQKERMSNAKEVYYLWREKQIDLYHGEPAIPLISNKLTLSLDVPMSNSGAFATRRGNRESSRLNRISLLDIKPPNWKLAPSDSLSTPALFSEQASPTTTADNANMSEFNELPESTKDNYAKVTNSEELSHERRKS